MSTPSLATLYSEDAERSVLGGMLLRPALIGTTTLEVPDFHNPRHQAVFEAMRGLDSDGLEVDPTTVVGELRRTGRLGVFADEATAVAYIAGELALHVPSPENVHAYSALLVRYARKRTALDALSEAVHRLRTQDEADGEDQILETVSRLQRIDLREPDPTRGLSDLVREELRQIHADMTSKIAGHHVGGIPTGIDGLDTAIGGLPRGVVTLVIGETGHGKTTLAMQFASAAARLAGDTPLLFSYEDAGRSYAQRALAQEARVPTTVIARRSFRGSEARDVADAGSRAVENRPERIAAWRGQTVDELCRTVRRLRSRGPQHGRASVGRLVIVDYLQAIPRNPRLGVPDGIGDNARTLEDLAAREDIAVVVMSQVNDEPMKREANHRPQGRDVAGSRDPLKGCKVCLGLYRPAVYEKGVDERAGEILVLKNNQGPSGLTVNVRLDLATHTIRDA